MVKIYYNNDAFRSIMKGKEISEMEQNMMMSRLNQIEAEFLQRFGFEGAFELKRVDTNSNRSRTTYRIVAANSRTTAVLKREPGWLGKFMQ